VQQEAVVGRKHEAAHAHLVQHAIRLAQVEELLLEHQ
jgi:hypothetical protein